MGIGKSAKKLFPVCPMWRFSIRNSAWPALPPEAYIYALPYAMYTELHVRRYGFHGTSHKFIARKTAEFLKTPERTALHNHAPWQWLIHDLREGRQMLRYQHGPHSLSKALSWARCGSIDPAIVPLWKKK